uniref:Uncharacterized protein n=1 Tax=Sphaerodactylus townsendi TaxID=933632 RepID=A0ACB8G096_9SAUR
MRLGKSERRRGKDENGLITVADGNIFVMIFALNEEALVGHNIFANLSSKDYSDLMQLLKKSILATDLTLYFE